MKYIQVSNLLENLYPVRDGPFDFQGGCDFFGKKICFPTGAKYNFS